MKREYYLDLAAQGLRMPIGTDLILKEKPDHDKRVMCGNLLGQVIVEATERFKTPLAFPLMDLAIEKHDLLTILGIPEDQIKKFLFTNDLTAEMVEQVRQAQDTPATGRLKATCDAVTYVADNTNYLPIGMVISPFSLMVKTLKDPIVPIFMSGSGMTGDQDPDVQNVEWVLEMATLMVLRSVRYQIEAGAKAICICEPAANKAYISPNQMDDGSDVFDRLVIKNLERINAIMAKADVDMILHDCGELTTSMLKALCTIDPAILSLGSSQVLWEVAKHVPKNIVLFGNLPSKKFFSDTEITVEQVRKDAAAFIQKMQEVNHPYILASECDVLSVPGAEETLKKKVNAMLFFDGQHQEAVA